MTKTMAQNCILCRGNEYKVVEESGDPYKVVCCKGCGLIFVSPIPSLETIKKAYPEDYYTPWLLSQRNARIRMWTKRLKKLNTFSKKRGNLLDVGCGEGLFLELARTDGWGVTGTEISQFAVKYGIEKLGLNVFEGEIPKIGFHDKTFDAITMWHVLEHTTNPIAVLKEARRILKDDGVFILAVPNLNNFISQWAYRLIKGKRMHLFDIKDREIHLYHFTPKTIKMILEKTGFKALKIVPDMGMFQWHLKSLNYLAVMLGCLTGKIITDAIEIHALPD